MVVDAEVMLEPHHRGRGRAPVPHGRGGIGGDDPDPAPVAEDPAALWRGWEKRPDTEREESHGRGSAAASAAAAAAEEAIDGDNKGGARARPWRSCGGGRLLGGVVNFLWPRAVAAHRGCAGETRKAQHNSGVMVAGLAPRGEENVRICVTETTYKI